MEIKDLINLFIQIIAIMLTMAGGFFAFWKYASSRIDGHFQEVKKDFVLHKTDTDIKIDRVYQRMDERNKLYFESFIAKAVYDAVQAEKKENIDRRFTQVIEILNEKVEGLKMIIQTLAQNTKSGQK